MSFSELNEEFVLKEYGYTVNATDDLADDFRIDRLKKIVDLEILIRISDNQPFGFLCRNAPNQAVCYYVIPYSGKLTDYTIDKTASMYVPLVRNGVEKTPSVLVVEDKHLIYVNDFTLKNYESNFYAFDYIELRRNI